MELLGSLFVGKPLNILAVDALFLAAHVALRATPLGGCRWVRTLRRALTYSILPDLEGLRAFPHALYSSFVTFTTLGYGDITIVGKWRLLSGVEAMNGILLFGWSTAMLFGLIQQLWRTGYSLHGEKGR